MYFTNRLGTDSAPRRIRLPTGPLSRLRPQPLPPQLDVRRHQPAPRHPPGSLMAQVRLPPDGDHFAEKRYDVAPRQPRRGAEASAHQAENPAIASTCAITRRSPMTTMLQIFTAIPRPTGSGNSYFMPISMGNRYYSRSRVKRAASLFLEKADSSVVVPCDRLRLLSYLTRRGVSADQAAHKVQDECMNMMRMLDNVGISKISNCYVIPMSVFYADPALVLFLMHSRG